MPGQHSNRLTAGRLHSEVVRNLQNKEMLISTQLTPCEHRSSGLPRMGMEKS